MIDVRKTPEDVRVTDHALILRLPPHLSARRLENYCVVRGGGDGDGDGDGSGTCASPCTFAAVGDEKSHRGWAPGAESRHPRALCHAWLRWTAATSSWLPRTAARGRGNASSQKKKRVAPSSTGSRTSRTGPARAVLRGVRGAEAPGFEQAMGCRGAEWGAEWEDDVIHAHHRNKATHLRARYRARRGFRGENNGAHSPGRTGVNYGARVSVRARR